MELIQEKLNVSFKKRKNLFNWRGQFTPEFVEYILKTFTKDGDYIFDPFSGSGTVLMESARLNLRATGFEINPAGYAMSKFFSFCNLSFEERLKFCNAFELKLNSQLSKLNGQKLPIKNSDYRNSYSNLLQFAKEFNSYLRDKKERILLLNLLFQSEKDRGLMLKDSIFKSLFYIKNCLLELPYSNQTIDSFLEDAKNSGNLLQNQVDFILTSPPYINVFNYHQNYRAIIETFKFDVLKVAQSEIGSNRKNRGNRFKTVIQYCIDMEQSIREFWKALKPNSKIVLVLGRESRIRGIAFHNGQIVIDILENCNGFNNIKRLERQFMNKFGDNIKEDIIIATKSNVIGNTLHANEIALKHLNSNLIFSKNDVDLLKEALSAYETWGKDLNKLTSLGEDRIKEMTALLNGYKDYIEVDLIASRGSDFLKRQKGQLKLDNSILEEFLIHLVNPAILNNLPAFQLDTGPQTAFMSLAFRPSSISKLNEKPEVILKVKDQDFTIGKEVHYKFSSDPGFNKDKTINGKFFLAVLAAECKVNYDKTMFQECAGTAARLKQGCPIAKYYALVEYLDMQPEDPRLTEIDNVFLIRKAKRLPFEKRNVLAEIKAQHKCNPISADVISIFVKELQSFIDSTWYDPDLALKKGSFI